MSNLRDTVKDAKSVISSMSDLKDTLNTDESEKGRITQSERAFTVRPRSTPRDNDNKYTSDRGPISSIKLLTNGMSKSDILGQTGLSTQSSVGSAVSSTLDKLLSDDGYSDFLLTNVDVSFDEKVQINEVFGDSEVVYYFGRSPIQFNISGLVFDDVDNNWFYNFICTYSEVLRGTKLAKNYMLARINLPNMVITGSIMGITYSQDSSRDTDIRFSMRFLAKTIIPKDSLGPSEVLNNQALKLDFDIAETFDRFTDRASINSIKKKLSDAKAYLGKEFDVSSNAITEAIEGFGDAVSGAISTARGFFDDSVSGLFSVAEIRATLFSPVYGVITTLTKVVESITGEIMSLVTGGTSPLTDILKDVRNIANEAISLVDAVQGGVNELVTYAENTGNDVRRTIQALKNASGAISQAPENIASILKRLDKVGRKKGSIASLKSGSRSRAKAAILNSGTPYNSNSGAVIN